MFASFTTVMIRVDLLDEATRIWFDEILPVTRTVPGWKDAELFVDSRTGQSIAVNFYESAAAVDQVESSGGFAKLMAKLAPVVTAPPLRQVYEVRDAGTVRKASA